MSRRADTSKAAQLASAIYACNDALTAVAATYEECSQAAERLAGYRGLRPSDAGIRRGDVTQPVFLKTEFHSEAVLRALLAELREVTRAAQTEWAWALSLLPGEHPGRTVADVIAWGIEYKVGAGVMDSLLTKALFVNTNFGTTPESFWAESDRLNAVIGA